MTILTILSENTARGAGVLGEHGLAWWIDTGSHRVLFDTGQGLVLRPNAARLRVDLARADAIVLSHGHYDHVGGLEQALAAAPNAALYLHPAATVRRYSGRPGEGPARRLSTDFMETEAFRAGGRRVVECRGPTEIVPGLWCTGEIPRCNDFEDTGGPFYLDETLATPDPIADDMALYFETRDGLTVVLGCAHAGVVNTLEHIRKTTGLPIRALFGGMHLEASTRRRLDLTMDALSSLGITRFGPNHCTGLPAVTRLWTTHPTQCVQCAAGTRHEFV